MTKHYESPSALFETWQLSAGIKYRFTSKDEMRGETLKCTEERGERYQACVLFCVKSDRIMQNKARGEERGGEWRSRDEWNQDRRYVSIQLSDQILHWLLMYHRKSNPSLPICPDRKQQGGWREWTGFKLYLPVNCEGVMNWYHMISEFSKAATYTHESIRTVSEGHKRPVWLTLFLKLGWC